jgi:hypothetical protein
MAKLNVGRGCSGGDRPEPSVPQQEYGTFRKRQAFCWRWSGIPSSYSLLSAKLAAQFYVCLWWESAAAVTGQTFPKNHFWFGVIFPESDRLGPIKPELMGLFLVRGGIEDVIAPFFRSRSRWRIADGAFTRPLRQLAYS